MSGFHVAHVNVALPIEPLGSPRLAGFLDALGSVNERADRTPGFVWRRQLSDADSVEARGFEDPRLLVTLSVWESLDAIRAFTYATDEHGGALRRRREWFERLPGNGYALWWVPPGHEPTGAEARVRLEHLDEHGPSPIAFTFARVHPPASPITPALPG
jgi:heme-degrading monooxygenase HmoA